ncbi:hypothetical protein RB614_15430 [Phytohabitans sp. ZYX-F-186]|uniref:Resolvase/invertase-type recombinase catalytic domain-containing protein n=1 Tax=Phytohabitans maris TaxID=3071409 RepID=A0ABU0ZFR6_9ACTN|nr:DUF3800 domain-containing protein [Phytohabitans sp. ZYX-F-186]MDQ7905908.1 hypothetical protein [Phytohabitans sp. ZYX-F-186]
MTIDGYADESIRGASFILALALIPSQARADVDRTVRSLRLPRQRRIHMVDERDSRRREVISTIVGLSVVRGLVYTAPRPVSRARPTCLSTLADDALRMGVGRLVLDRGEENQNRRDRTTLQATLTKSDVRYLHAPSWEHPGLQIADIIAWAYGAGGDWRRRISPVVDGVQRVEP